MHLRKEAVILHKERPGLTFSGEKNLKKEIS